VKVLIIGRGRVGHGLRRALAQSEVLEVELRGRATSATRVAKADIIVLTIPDDAISSVSEQIAPSLASGSAVLHCAGARGVEELKACKARGAAVGVMHPLVSFASERATPSLDGTTFTVSGDPEAVAASRVLANACGARVVIARTGDPAYHAAAALAANGAVGLAFTSVLILERLGFERRAAERAIGGLLQTVGQNVQRLGVPGALTGPVARGEPETIARHRTSLRRLGDKALSTYDAVLPVVVECAKAAGLPERKATDILAVRRR
jgi:predicted short-subunit dehydrogenase-like oxidoreductase (DUF2520 family)